MAKIFVNKNWVGLACLCMLVILAILAANSMMRREIAYANGAVLFERFKMTVEARKRGDSQARELTNVIDSLSVSLKEGEPQVNAEKLVKIGKMRDSLSAFQQKFAQEQAQAIILRIKAYSREFAQAKSFEILVAPQQTEDVLYASESIDVTEELLQYINKRYEGL